MNPSVSDKLSPQSDVPPLSFTVRFLTNRVPFDIGLKGHGTRPLKQLLPESPKIRGLFMDCFDCGALLASGYIGDTHQVAPRLEHCRAFEPHHKLLY